MKTRLLEIVKDLPGQVSYYYKNLATGEEIGHNDRLAFPSASLIKIPILIDCLYRIGEGELSPDRRIELREEDKSSSAGVLHYMDEGLRPSIRDLYTLMIIHSDNTATNILIDLLGREAINQRMRDLGYEGFRLERKMMDSQALAGGQDNYLLARELGDLLENVYRKEVLDREVASQVEQVLLRQKIRHKIPYLLDDGLKIAGKTGDNAGVTNDVAIIYSENPFIFTFLSRDTDRILAEDAMRQMAKELYEYTN